MGEAVLRDGGDEGPTVRVFARAGVSDGRTSPFAGGWQAGLRVDAAVVGRPDSALGLGVEQGLVSRGYRESLAGDGLTPADAETRVEVTYSDRLTSRVLVQPDLQVIWNPGGLRDASPVVVAGIRLTVALVQSEDRQ